NPIVNVRLTFDANAPTLLPATTQITSGTYRPANYAGLGTADTFPPPAPPLPYTNTDLTVLNGTNPNGNWSLFIVDDTSSDAGSLGGWSLSIQTSDPVAPAPAFAVADVGVRASGGSSTVVLGGLINSSVLVTNSGPGAASNVGLLSDVPEGLAVVSASPSAGTLKKVGGKLIWSVGSLPAGS